MKSSHKPKFSEKAQLIKLTGLALLSILFLVAYLNSVEKKPHPAFDEMVRVAQRLQNAQESIRKLRDKWELPVESSLDPNLTGWIGSEFSAITTTLGNLEAKQTSLQPDFAALLVHWVWDLDLEKGDKVALQLSGSFPSLNIAAIMACEVLDLKPQITSSLGASSYGANLPELTYADIENHLFQTGFIHHRSTLVSGGGEEDTGDLVWQGGDSLLQRAAERNGYLFFKPENLSESIQRKWDFYWSGLEVKLFINVGGNHASLGNCRHSSALPVGLMTPGPFCQDSARGMLIRFREQGIPVIHLLDIRRLAVENGLPLDPFPFNAAGISDVYYRSDHPRYLDIIFPVLLFLLLIFLRQPDHIPLSFNTTSTRER